LSENGHANVAFRVIGEGEGAFVARARAGDCALPAALVCPLGRLVCDRAAITGGSKLMVAQAPPAVLIVMGVAGSGKSTIGSLLVQRLHWELEDADWLHPASNVEKMHSGVPLTDEDRWPWLRAVAGWIDQTRRAGGHGVVPCSALKRRYRDILIGDRADVRLVYLKGDEPLIARRLATRHEHFMPRSLLHSQFEALEEPGADENPIIVSIEPPPREIVARILSALNIGEDARRSEEAYSTGICDDR
jgi:gluconokinase